MRIIERQYGSTDPVYFELWETDGTDFESTPPTFAAGDTQISKDGAAFANATNDPVHEGGGAYSWTPSGTELEGKAVMLRIIDQTGTKVWLDKLMVIETKGHPSAMHPHEGVPLPDSGLVTGTPTSTTADLGGNLPNTDDIVNGTAIYFSAGTGAGQTRQITDYDEASDEVTVDPAWATTPDTTTVYHLIPAAPAPTASANLPQVTTASILAAALADLFDTDSGTTYASAVAGSVVKEIADNAGGSSLTVADIADGVWDEAQTDHTTGGTFGEIATEIASILADTNELQSDDVPGLIAALNDLSTAEVNAEVDTALGDYDAPTKAELDSGLAALNDPTAAAIVAALFAEAVEGTTTFQESMALQNAAAAGKASGMGTTSAVLRDLADTIDRIAATVDADGNRTAVTTTFTDL